MNNELSNEAIATGAASVLEVLKDDLENVTSKIKSALANDTDISADLVIRRSALKQSISNIEFALNQPSAHLSITAMREAEEKRIEQHAPYSQLWNHEALHIARESSVNLQIVLINAAKSC